MKISLSYTFTVSVIGLICINVVYVGQVIFPIQLLFNNCCVKSVVNLFTTIY